MNYQTQFKEIQQSCDVVKLCKYSSVKGTFAKKDFYHLFLMHNFKQRCYQIEKSFRISHECWKWTKIFPSKIFRQFFCRIRNNCWKIKFLNILKKTDYHELNLQKIHLLKIVHFLLVWSMLFSKKNVKATKTRSQVGILFVNFISVPFTINMTRTSQFSDTIIQRIHPTTVQINHTSADLTLYIIPRILCPLKIKSASLFESQWTHSR